MSSSPTGPTVTDGGTDHELTSSRSPGRRLPSVFTARATLCLFAYLALAWQLQYVVDIYASVVYRVLFVPAYLVALFAFDGLLEVVVYPVAPYLPGSGPVVWEAGVITTFYLFAVGVVWVVGLVRR